MATEYGLRLRAARKHAQMTQVEASKASGIPQSTISTSERESHGSSETPVFAKLYGVDAHWLATGEGEMVPAAGAVQSSALLDTGLPDGAVRVPVLANAASMGGGIDLADEDVICGELTLTPQFVAEQLRPVRPGALRFIHGYGDSMAPTFNSGDVLLVDTDMRDVKIDGIYVLEAHNRLFIKRVRQRLDGSYEISSDNPTHKTVDTLNGDHQVEVKGRVVWAWNGRKL